MPMMSPRTQGMAQGAVPSDQAKTLFDQGLSQMAYNVLINKLPTVAPDVITFKVLESDPDEGSGVGAFVIMRRGQTVYVPVVMADNQIKPLDILYYKDMNVFLPLSKEWLQELDKLSVDEMGKGVPTPNTLNTDVDIRNTVVPPTTGRYSYAADQAVGSVTKNVAKKKPLTEVEAVKQAGRVFDEARLQIDPEPAFLQFLNKAPNRVKKAAARLLETHPKFLKAAVWHYGEEALINALHQTEEKVADYGGKMSRTGALYIADKKTSPKEFRDVFGAQSPMAFQGVTLKGYFAKDDRKEHNRAIQVHMYKQLVEPKSPGAYKFWKRDGSEVMALVINDPTNVFARDSKSMPERIGYRYYSKHHAPVCSRYIGVTEDGKLLDSHCSGKSLSVYPSSYGDSTLIGEPMTMEDLEGSKVYKNTFAEKTVNPRAGQTGIFVSRRGSSFIATVPVKIKSVTDNDAGQTIEVEHPNYDWDKATIVRPLEGRPGMLVNKHGQTVHVGRDFSFVPTSGELEMDELFNDPKQILAFTVEGVKKSGADRVVVKKARDRGWTFGDSPTGDYAFTDALYKLSMDAGITVEDAEYALKTAEENGRCEFFTFSAKAYNKMAAESKPKSGAPDPAEAAMQQVAGAQMAQAGQPTPTDMAVAEQMQNLQGQAASIQQQMQMLQMVAQRANMIAGTGGMAGNPAAGAAAMAGPMDPSMMGAGMPSQQQGAPQPGGMGGGQPGQPQQPGMGMGGPQQPSPGIQMMGQPQQPQQPGVMSGGDPSQQQQGGAQQGMAAMTSDDTSPEALAAQVNPQFAEQASQLQDKGVFDSAALASMAQSPALKDMVGAYLPNLEKSLDNVGRVLLTLWMDESKIKDDVGDEAYISLEDNLRTTFRGLGDLIRKINQTTMVMKAPNDTAMQE